MSSVPMAKAGVGSAMNDTTRMIGGALGVAVLGSVLASSYGSSIEPGLRGLPPQIAKTAADSIGGASRMAAQLGPQGQDLLDAARSAFIQAMADTVLVGVGAAAFGALLVLRFLPARAGQETPAAAEVPQLEAARVGLTHSSGIER